MIQISKFPAADHADKNSLRNASLLLIALNQPRIFAIRAWTNFFTSVLGSGLSGENRIVPLLV